MQSNNKTFIFNLSTKSIHYLMKNKFDFTSLKLKDKHFYIITSYFKNILKFNVFFSSVARVSFLPIFDS